MQSGKPSTIELHPASQGSGIVFRRTDLAESPQMRLPENILHKTAERRSAVSIAGAAVQTIEHLLAALWGSGIDNVSVEVSGEEVPALGGSAKEYVELLEKAGTRAQELEREYIEIDREIEVASDNSSIRLFPHEHFSVSYTIDYPLKCIGRQKFFFDPRDMSFADEIAPARTFCMRKEAEALLKKGLGQGADFENTLVLEDEGPCGTQMRFADEPVRHKVLDLLGDLYMLGRPLKCRVEAVRSGHRLNAALVRRIYEEYIC